MGVGAGGDGLYNMTDGELLAPRARIGYRSNGKFVQDGGVVTISGLLSGNLYVGDGGGSDGTYQLKGGDLYASVITIGRGGKGLIEQSGGYLEPDYDLQLGDLAGSEGTYKLTGGEAYIGTEMRVGHRGTGTFEIGGAAEGISVETLVIGRIDDGKGTVTQTAGYVYSETDVYMGQFDSTSQGEYTIDGADSEFEVEETIYVGQYGSGTLTQKNGTVLATAVILGAESGGDGTGRIEGGLMDCEALSVGREGLGNLTQTGGEVNVSGSVDIGYDGTGDYTMEGGTLNADHLRIGRWGGDGTFYYTDGELNVEQLTVFSDTDEGTPYGFHSLKDWTFGGTLQLQGTFNFGEHWTFTLDGGSGGEPGGGGPPPPGGEEGGAHAGLSGRFIAKDFIMGDAGSASGWTDGGIFTIHNDLILGKQAGGSGQLDLAAESMTVGNILYVGKAGTGRMTNWGPVAASTSVVLGDQTGAEGTFEHSGDTLTTPILLVGRSGHGDFTQEGGTVNVNNILSCGANAGGHGNYMMTDGVLNARNLYVGDGGGGVFEQTGGDVNILSLLSVGDEAGPNFGEYRLNDGDVDAPTTVIGYEGVGRFKQGGGVHTVSGDLVVGEIAGSDGFYEMRGGEASAETIHVAQLGEGEITQYDGTMNVLDDLFVGCQLGGDGKYTIVGGTLDIALGKISVGLHSGTGHFELNGGTVIVDEFAINHPSVFSSTNVTSNLRVNKLTGFEQGNFAGNVELGHTVTDRIVRHTVAASESLTVGGQLIVGMDAYAWLTQTGGTVNVGTDLVLGEMPIPDKAGGVYQLDAGTVRSHGTFVGNEANGWFYHYGGTHQITDSLVVTPLNRPDITGLYEMHAGTLTSTHGYIGSEGPGDFWQYGGSYTLTGTLYVGYYATGDKGWYWIEDGNLNAGAMVVGHEGRGLAQQVGTGANVRVTGSLTVAHKHDSSYELEHGDLHAGSVLVGDRAAGTFKQTGGSHTVDGDVALAVNGNATAEYLLKGGQLNVGGSISSGSGVSRMILSGGGMYVAGDMTVDYVNVSGDAAYQRASGTTTVRNTMTLGANGFSGGWDQSGGTLVVSDLLVGDSGRGVFEISDAAAHVTVSSRLAFGPDSSLMTVPGSTIHMTGSDFQNESTNPADLAALSHLGLVFEGGPGVTDSLEAAGENRGDTLAGFTDNFAHGTLALGGAAVGKVRLDDLVDNQPGWGGAESLYVINLAVGAGSRLDLNGIDLYYLNATVDPGGEVIGGTITRVDVPGSEAVPEDPSTGLPVSVSITEHTGTGYGYGTAGIVGEGSFAPLSTTFELDAGEMDAVIAASAEGYVTLKLFYDEDELAAIVMNEQAVRPYWWDETAGQWLLGGTDTNGDPGESVFAGVNVDIDSYGVGYCGLDTTDNFAWVNATHASVYGLVGQQEVIPEPATLSLLALGGMALVRRRKLRACK
jgi:T5SS/PEP-CTERM-associated repeat protein